jgi:hypothetical protein
MPQSIEERLDILEKKVSEFNGTSKKTEKKPRAASKYNTFVQEYIEKEKKGGSTKNHKDLFKEAAKAWSATKPTSPK